MKFITILLMVVIASVTVQSKILETFLINGTNTTDTIGFYAYLEIFRQDDFGGPTMYFGGGTVITTSFILTVAQNVAGLSTTAFIHHGYDDQTLVDNIALLRLTQLTSSGTGIIRISLPTSTSSSPNQIHTVTLYGFGFGTTNHQPDVLKTASFNVTTQHICEARYPHLGQSGHTSNYFCAAKIATDGNICAGDQGGPAIISSTVFGIQSFYRYENCGSPEAQPAAFIRVPRYVDWINNVTSTQTVF